MAGISEALDQLQRFTGADLTSRIANLEIAFDGADRSETTRLLQREAVTHEVLASAFFVKRAAGEINVVIHALGILLLVPHLLVEGERIEYLSLGAGNSGRAFDLETTHRVAEFKFSRWQGGSDTIRQNSFFKDFFQLAEYQTTKDKYVYVLDLDLHRRFLNCRRSLDSVLSKNAAVKAQFASLYGDRFKTVRDYYGHRRAEVEVIDAGPQLSELSAIEVVVGESADD